MEQAAISETSEQPVNDALENLIGQGYSMEGTSVSESISSIVATANQGSISVAEAMRKAGIEPMSTSGPSTSNGTFDEDEVSQTVSTGESVAFTGTSQTIKQDLGMDLNEIFRVATGGVSTASTSASEGAVVSSVASTQSPKILIPVQSTPQPKHVLPKPSNTTQITIRLQDGDASGMNQQKIQEIVQQLISSGRIEVKKDNKVVVNIKNATPSPQVSQASVHIQPQPQPQQQTLLQQLQSGTTLSQLTSQSSSVTGSLGQGQILTLSSPGGQQMTAGGLSSQDILKIVSQASQQQHEPVKSSPLTLARGNSNLQLTGASSNAASNQQGTFYLVPAAQMTPQLKVISPKNVQLSNAVSGGASSNVVMHSGAGDVSNNLILVQYGDQKALVTPQALAAGGALVNSMVSGSGVSVSGMTSTTPRRTLAPAHLEMGRDILGMGESPWQQYVKQFNKLGPCPICGDKISGYHYGIFCCESCKGFFKRTVQNGKQYVCHMPSSSVACEITVNSRKKCPSCRFAKCVDKGMRVEAIRTDRTRGGRSMYPGARSRSIYRQSGLIVPKDDMDSSSADEESMETSGRSVSAQRPGSTGVSELTGGNAGGSGNRYAGTTPGLSQLLGGYNRKKMTNLPKVLADIVMVEQLVAGEEDTLDFSDSDDEAAVYRALLQLSDQRLYRIVRWSRNLPEFAGIDTDDQILLLQNCWADLLCLDCCWKSLPTPKEIRLTAHKCINLDAARELGADEVVSSIMQLTQDLDRLKLDLTEYACLKVILLMQPDLKNLKATSGIRTYQEQVSQLLMEYTLTTYPHMTNKFGELFLRIPELHRTSTMAREMLGDKDLSPYLSQNSLLMELLRSDNKTVISGGSTSGVKL